MKTIFITATGTDIGKTYVTAALLRKIPNCIAVKPVITGFKPVEENDTTKIAEITSMQIEDISPWRFTRPAGADIAGDANFDDVVEFCKKERDCDVLLIEGAGGVMSPVNKEKTYLDLVNALDCEVILVTGSYLGSITHTLTALEVLKGKHVRIIVSESEGSPISLRETAESLRRFTVAEIIELPRGGNLQIGL